jgi:LmbE family N-acetylglucosaminyl deacetylase
VTRILAIGAHPDDVDLGCGGLLQRGEGNRIVVLSHGERGGNYRERAKEQCEAEAVLGVSLRQYEYPDTAMDMSSTIEVLESELREFAPDIVLTMAERDTHQDHRLVHQATLSACRDFAGTILAYVGPSSAATFRPTWFVPLTEAQLAVKVRAVACHKSQQHHAYVSQESVEGMAHYWSMSMRSKSQWIEPYEVVRAWMV